MTAKITRQRQVDAILNSVAAPVKTGRYEATCVKCQRVHKSYTAVERCARSHDGGGRVDVRLTW